MKKYDSLKNATLDLFNEFETQLKDVAEKQLIDIFPKVFKIVEYAKEYNISKNNIYEGDGFYTDLIFYYEMCGGLDVLFTRHENQEFAIVINYENELILFKVQNIYSDKYSMIPTIHYFKNVFPNENLKRYWYNNSDTSNSKEPEYSYPVYCRLYLDEKNELNISGIHSFMDEIKSLKSIEYQINEIYSEPSISFSYLEE